MDATIYMGDDFKVKGIKIESNNVKIFEFGSTGYYQTWTKTLIADKYTAEVLALIKLREMLNYYSSCFASDFFNIFQNPENMGKRYNWTKEYRIRKDASVFFGEYNDQKAEQLKTQIWNIINKIK